MPLGSTSGDNDVELMTHGNSSDEVNLTKAGRAGSVGSDSDGNGNAITGKSNGRGGQTRVIQHNGGGSGYNAGGIRVKTEVQMTVDEWAQPDKKRGDVFGMPE